MAVYRSTIELGHGGKGIPYGGFGKIRPDGGANCGFKDLKSDITGIETVPELLADPALKSLVLAINQPATGLFSVGCASGEIEDASRHRRGGYVEIAINSKMMVPDAKNYFPLFFHFSRMLQEEQFAEHFDFSWVLDSVSFIYQRVDGFTICIWLNTHFFGSKGEAKACWDSALAALTKYLGAFPIQHGEPLYPIATSALNDVAAEAPRPG